MPEIANGSVFSQSDSSNTGALPGITGSSSPALIDNSIQALMGAIKREHDWRNFTITASGSANAYVLTYSVAPAAYYTGQAFGFKTNFAVTGAATVNVNTLGAKTIKKLVSGTKTDLASGDIASGDYVSIVYDGTDFVWVNKGVASVSAASTSTAGISQLATTTEVLTGTDTAKTTTPDAIAALWEQGSDVASAGTISLGEGGYFNITGTTTITDIDFATDKAGRKAWVKFAGALTLTHNASTLILPGGASITTAAGDTACFVSEGSDVVRCTVYQKASGLPVVSPASTSPTRIYKTSDETVTNSTVFQNDDHLLFSVAANTKYAGRFVLFINDDSAAGLGSMKVQFTGPASPTKVNFTTLCTSFGGTATTTVNGTTSFSSSINAVAQDTNTDHTLMVDFVIQNGANAGTVTLQWAQRTASLTATTVYAGSYVDYQVVS